MMKGDVEMKRSPGKSKAMYENEVEKPSIPRSGMNEPMMNCEDLKGGAMEIAYGQAGKKGCASDEKKIKSQFKNYGWESNSEY